MTRLERSGLSDTVRSGYWNIARGIAFSILTAGPPMIAAQLISTPDYTAWVVIFSFTPWLLISQVGLQPGVLAVLGRHGQALSATTQRVLLDASRLSAEQYLAVSVAGLAFLALLDTAGVEAVAVSSAISHRLILALVAVGGFLQALNSVANAFMIAIGSARSMALWTCAGAATLVLGTAAVVATGAKLTGAGLTALVVLALCVPLVAPARRARQAGRPASADLPAGAKSTETRKELRKFMVAQAVWVVPGVLVMGLDNILVAEYDPGSLRLYSFSLAAMALSSGAAGALASPFISRMSSEVWRDGSEVPAGSRRHSLYASAAQLSRWILAISGAVFLSALLLALIGVPRTDTFSVVPRGQIAVVVLAGGIASRLLTIPVATVAIAARRQSSLFPSALGEAAMNVVASVVLGLRYGAVGVATGTLLGSVVAICAHGFAVFRLLGPDYVSVSGWVRTVPLPTVAILGAVVVVAIGLKP